MATKIVYIVIVIYGRNVEHFQSKSTVLLNENITVKLNKLQHYL